MSIFMRRQRFESRPGNTAHTRVVKTPWRIADVLSGTRLLLIPILSVAALLGNGRLVAIGLLVAGATDFLDGYLARRLGQASKAGARLDSLADNLLLVAAVAWIELLHPEILRENTALVAVAIGLYLASLKGGRLNLLTSKVAGGALYAFTVITLLAGGYEPLLLWVAAGTFIVSSAETLLVHASHTIHPIGRARKQRSHAPQAAKVVGSSATPTSSIPTSATPTATEIRP
jgi:phosphatidylglycerophosphate synthase